MNSLQGLLYGLHIAATPANLLAAFVGAFAGTAIGVLPGLGPVAGVALILPLTFSLDPTAGLIMMAGIFYGSMYGGSTTAILLNIPGESASVVTAIDGYQLAKKGRAGATLTIVAVGSFVGGTLAVIGVMMFSSLLAKVAILFGPAEFFALTAGGLIVMSRISGGTLASALLPMTLGLMLGTIGQEAVTGETRFTFDFPDLAEGVSLVPVVVGLYGFAELMLLVQGFQPGPVLITQHPEIFWGLIASAYIGNVMLLALNIPMVGVWVSLLRIPHYLFIPLLLVLSVIGTYSVRNSIFDVWVLLAAGIVGYAFNKMKFQLAPLVVGLILGPNIEKHFREALFLSDGDPWIYLQSPIAIAVWLLLAAILIAGFVARRRAAFADAMAQESSL